MYVHLHVEGKSYRQERADRHLARPLSGRAKRLPFELVCPGPGILQTHRHRGLLVGLRIAPFRVTLDEATDAIGILKDALLTVEGWLPKRGQNEPHEPNHTLD
jgi:hypothetical protein